LDAARARGLQPQAMLSGLHATAAQVQSPAERIDWDDFLELIRRLRAVVPQDSDWVEVGRGFTRGEYVMRYAKVAVAFFSLRTAFEWAFRFVGHRIFSNMNVHLEGDEANLRLTLSILPLYPPCPEYFHICAGTFSEVGRLFGEEPVPVALALSEDGRTGTYVISLRPAAQGSRVSRALAGFWQRLRYLFRGRGLLLQEFERSEKLLEERYVQLEGAKDTIEKQQRTLEVVHDIATAAHTSLEPEDVLAVICGQLVQRLGFAWAGAEVHTTIDGVQVDHLTSFGTPPPSAVEREVPLVFHGAALGLVKVMSPATRPPSEAESELLWLVVDASAMAVSNALSFEVVRRFRAELETRVEARTRELADARNALQKSLESRTRFFANVNHDLRTPLAVLMLTLERLSLLPALPESAARLLGSARQSGERLRALVEELLLLAPGAEAKGLLRLKTLPVDGLVHVVLESVRPLAEQRGLKLEEVVEPGLELTCDARLVERALVNLVSNALKHTTMGHVRVTARRIDDEVVLAVEDTGTGIAPEHQAQLFERFFQVPGDAAPVGTGIGLSLVKEVVQQHGGRVDAHSTKGQGSTFRLIFPVPGAGAVASAPPRRAVVAHPPEENALEAALVDTVGPQVTGEVLVVEDDPLLQQEVAELLELGGLTVRRAGSFHEALASAARYPPDLLLTDVELGPGPDGYELTRTFRAAGNHRNAPVIIMTASPRRTVIDSLEQGAVDFLEKPFRFSELVARVKAHLRFRHLNARLLTSERVAAQGMVLQGVAHELRNPLNGLVNATAPLRALLPEGVAAPGSPITELLEVIEDCSRRVAQLSRELEAALGGELGPLTPLPLGPVLDGALKLAASALRTAELRTLFEYGGTVRGAGPALTQALSGVVARASLSAGAGGKVVVHSTLAGSRVLIDVRDSGSAPTPERERWLAGSLLPGTGDAESAALVMARETVRQHGGDIEVLATGDGAGFRVWLPAPGSGGRS
jgi:signal transduction histidine kinase